MFHPTGPYPLIALVGRQGSAKSTTARSVQAVVDTTIIEGNSEVRNDEDLMILAQHRWLIGIDNCSSLV
jgi:ABC-type dipeptide/oligopeptide/nickel transport system ATPase component